ESVGCPRCPADLSRTHRRCNQPRSQSESFVRALRLDSAPIKPRSSALEKVPLGFDSSASRYRVQYLSRNSIALSEHCQSLLAAELQLFARPLMVLRKRSDPLGRNH